MPRQTIVLTDDLRHDEPDGYLVLCPDSCATCDYRVFASEREANDVAHEHAERTGCDWLVYPLYAADPGEPPTTAKPRRKGVTR